MQVPTISYTLNQGHIYSIVRVGITLNLQLLWVISITFKFGIGFSLSSKFGEIERLHFYSQLYQLQRKIENRSVA